ncbi:hypothetical protein D3C71_1267850 [compost metagenome]
MIDKPAGTSPVKFGRDILLRNRPDRLDLLDLSPGPLLLKGKDGEQHILIGIQLP